MKPGPLLASRSVQARIELSAKPRRVIEIVSEICLENGWASNPADAREDAERWTSQVVEILRQEESELARVGRFAPYTFNSSSPEHIQGCAFIEPRDSEELKAAKRNRARFKSYEKILAEITPREFEMLCAGVLEVLGVDAPILTPSSADEGIDFYGRLQLEKHIFPDKQLPGLQRQLIAWMIGQAKHYKSGLASTPGIRDLVGAIHLAKSHAFGSGENKYNDLSVRACDPVFYLFFSTGRLTANSWTLLERSGAVGMDGQMLAAFLADHQIGMKEGVFDEDSLRNWLARFDPQSKKKPAAGAPVVD
jgi:hypothetical protein